MTLVDDFNKLTNEARSQGDLNQLETISQTISSFIDYPHKYNSHKIQAEIKMLKEILHKVSRCIAHLTIKLQKLDHLKGGN